MTANASDADKSLTTITAETVDNSSLMFHQFPQPTALPMTSVVVGLITGITGTCSNSVVLALLVVARQHFGNHVNTLISSQSAMDLLLLLPQLYNNDNSIIRFTLPRTNNDNSNYYY